MIEAHGLEIAAPAERVEQRGRRRGRAVNEHVHAAFQLRYHVGRTDRPALPCL